MSKYIPKYGESHEPPPLPTDLGVEYRHIVGWPGYAVGADGSLLTCRRTRKRKDAGQFKKVWHAKGTSPDQDGYRQFSAYRGDGTARTLRACQQVLIAFVGPKPPGMECRHLDGNNTNDNLANLEWGTAIDNARDRVKHGTCFLLNKGLAHPAAKISDDQVAEVLRLRAKGVPRAKLAAKFGITKSYITQLCYWGGRDGRRRKESKDGQT